MFDVDACGLAVGVDNPEALCMIAGTWSINEFITRAPITNGTVSLNSMYCIPGYFLIEESSPTSAGNMEWFINNLLSYERDACKAKGGSIYDLTNRWVEETDPASSRSSSCPSSTAPTRAPRPEAPSSASPTSTPRRICSAPSMRASSSPT